MKKICQVVLDGKDVPGCKHIMQEYNKMKNLMKISKHTLVCDMTYV